jgi:hypothetical protein
MYTFFPCVCVCVCVCKLSNRTGPQKRAAAAFHAPHEGRGCFDDFAFLFEPAKRAAMSSVYIFAAEAAFQSLFRLTVQEFIFVAKHVKPMLTRRRDKRGRKPIPLKVIMGSALLYLAHGLTYKMTAIAIRNGLSEVSHATIILPSVYTLTYLVCSLI